MRYTAPSLRPVLSRSVDSREKQKNHGRSHPRPICRPLSLSLRCPQRIGMKVRESKPII